MTSSSNNTEREVEARAQWERKVISERARHEALGWTREHDLAHGPDHLILETLEYAARGDTVAVGALQLALRDVLKEHDERVRAEQREQIITMVDASPAVTWTGKGGVRERIAAIREASDD